jgi:hypothetical protein
MQFLWNAHGRVNEDARFADTKAAAVIMLASGVIASLYAVKLHVPVLSKGPLEWGALEALSAGAYCLLGAGVVLALWAIKPRLTKAHAKGFVFWDSIRGHPSATEFWQAFRSQGAEDLTEHLAHHVHTLAGVCKRKYFWVGLSMWLAFLGALAGTAAVLMKDVLAKAP